MASGQLLERERELAALAGAVSSAGHGAGSVALVYGEAGIGKSSLVEAFRAQVSGEARLLVGYCDDLATKRALGPFRDLIGDVGTDLAAALRGDADQEQVLAALRAELDRRDHPTVLVVEDVHWADDATLDTLRFLIRRIGRLPAVLLLTYRDDELTRDHPAQDLLGLASATERVHRLPLERLSAAAVHQLSAGSRLDPDHLFAVTAGNPFFLSQILAVDGSTAVPSTVVDAVLARVRRLDGATRAAVEQLAVVPSVLSAWLVEALVPGGIGALAAAEERGLLVVSSAGVAFRHELTRQAVIDAVPGARLVVLHRNALAALTAREGSDLAQILHHAAQAGDREAIFRFGPQAAREAARAGAHREAAAHYRLVLAEPERFAGPERARLLEEYAVESYRVGAAHDAVSAQREAVELHRAQDGEALGVALRWLSRMYWWAGDRPAAEQAAREASAVLERVGDGPLLALALSNESQLHMLANRNADGIRLGERAAALAREARDPAILSHALTNVGMCRWTAGDHGGEHVVQEALRVALESGETEHALRAYQCIVSTLLDEYRLHEAGAHATAALDLAESADYSGFVDYMRLERARLLFARAAWDEALRAVEFAVDQRPPLRCPALTIVGRVRVRRGAAQAEQPLAEAWELAVGMSELQRTAPVAVALAEAAWLRGDHAAAQAVAGPAYDEACRLGDEAWASELGYWLNMTGTPVRLEGEHPYAIQAAGRWRDAAEAWAAAGCPYEHAAALADSPNPDDLLTALAQLDRLGGVPLARLVRARLRAMGVTRIPRGPMDATRSHPAGLTARQADVLQLLSEGLTNAEIADRLVLSTRTVEVHVAAVLDKLGASTRREAIARAAELGLAPQQM